MYTTSASLLERLRVPGDPNDWTRFVNLYTPLLFCWARRTGLQEEDAGDLVQDILTTLVQKLPEFHYDPEKSFRGWLITLMLNKLRDDHRRQALRPALMDQASLSALVAPDDAGEFAEIEYRRYVMLRALRLMQAEFRPTTWKACWEHVVSGRSAAEVAAELRMTEGAVYVAKSRVLSRLRQELAGLLD